MYLNAKNIALITVGWMSVILGVLGIFLPILPTTPFILLAGWCFSRSSKRFNDWLTNHPKLGPILAMWKSGNGIPRRARNRAILAIVLSMSLSAILVGRMWATLFLLVTGTCVTIYLMRLPVAQEE